MIVFSIKRRKKEAFPAPEVRFHFDSEFPSHHHITAPLALKSWWWLGSPLKRQTSPEAFVGEPTLLMFVRIVPSDSSRQVDDVTRFVFGLNLPPGFHGALALKLEV
jgi:hypothetical protein